jgi:hypothetical protein
MAAACSSGTDHVAVIVAGLVFAFVEHGSGTRRLFGVAFGGALALAALSFMTAVGLGGCDGLMPLLACA